MIVETGPPDHPFPAHAPTLRVRLPNARTDHVYLALGAMLPAVRAHNRGAGRRIRIAACPGPGTPAGRVPPEEAARQMAPAGRAFLHPPQEEDGKGKSRAESFARRRQLDVRYGGDVPSA